MILWMVLTVMAAVVAALLTLSLVRRHDARTEGREASLTVLADQLRELDEQAATGLVAPAEAEGMRTEIKRRMLAVERSRPATHRPLGNEVLGRIAVGGAALVVLAAVGIYGLIGRPDLGVTPDTPASPPAAQQGGADAAMAQLDGMIGQIEARLKDRPDDAEGWRMLGLARVQAGRFSEATDAYRRAIELDANVPGQQSAYGEALVLAADGIVTPEAKAAFAKAITEDGSDPRARYFLAVAKDQAGDRRGALDDWVKLLNEAPADAPWAGELRTFVEQAAQEGGVDLTGRLKPAPAAPRGPSAADIANAEGMSAGDQQAMIQSMVDGLAARLAANPRDADGWLRLIRAREVMGDTAGAAKALADARRVFADDPSTLARLQANPATGPARPPMR
jgi:cytochrome c-type biogenesis protein CcmH